MNERRDTSVLGPILTSLGAIVVIFAVVGWIYTKAYLAYFDVPVSAVNPSPTELVPQSVLALIPALPVLPLAVLPLTSIHSISDRMIFFFSRLDEIFPGSRMDRVLVRGIRKSLKNNWLLWLIAFGVVITVGQYLEWVNSDGHGRAADNQTAAAAIGSAMAILSLSLLRTVAFSPRAAGRIVVLGLATLVFFFLCTIAQGQLDAYADWNANYRDDHLRSIVLYSTVPLTDNAVRVGDLYVSQKMYLLMAVGGKYVVVGVSSDHASVLSNDKIVRVDFLRSRVYFPR